MLALTFLWWRLIDHLRVEWTVNEQYHYGWAVPFLCVYLLWTKHREQKEKLESGKQKTAGEAVFRCFGVAVFQSDGGSELRKFGVSVFR